MVHVHSLVRARTHHKNESAVSACQVRSKAQAVGAEESKGKWDRSDHQATEVTELPIR